MNFAASLSTLHFTAHQPANSGVKRDSSISSLLILRIPYRNATLSMHQRLYLLPALGAPADTDRHAMMHKNAPRRN